MRRRAILVECAPELYVNCVIAHPVSVIVQRSAPHVSVMIHDPASAAHAPALASPGV